MTMTALTALLSYWRRKPFQLATLVLGLALATALWTGVQAINTEARKSYAAAADTLGGNGLSSLVASDGALITTDQFVSLRRAGWMVSPVIDGWMAAEKGRLRLMGIDPFTFPTNNSTSQALATTDLQSLVGDTPVLLTSAETARRLTDSPVRIVISDGVAPGIALGDISVVANLTAMQGYSRLLLSPTQPLRQPPLEKIAPALTVRAPETAQDLGRLTDSFHLNLTAFGLLSFAVGLFIVNGAVGLAFEQRRATFRTLRALGVPARQLVFLLTLELMFIAALAGALGIMLGYAIAAALLPDVAATLSGLYGATVDGALTLSPAWWMSGLAVSALGTGVAAAGGLMRVARMSPLAPAQPRAWAMAHDISRHRLVVYAVISGAIGIILFFALGGLIGGFALLGGFLMTAALGLPPLLALILSLAARAAHGPIPQWFWADTRQQLPGLSLALMALLLALSANIGVSTMVGSFRLTFTGWLDQRLVSDIYVSAETPEDAPALREFLESRVDAVLPIWNTEGLVFGAPAEIYGVADHPIYARTWPLIEARPDTWRQLADGTGALINEQLANRNDLSPGDLLPLPGGWSTQILGIYSDYGNTRGQVVLPLAVLVERYPKIDRRDFGILVPRERSDAVRTALIEEFGLPADRMTDQAALKAFSLSVFERTFAVTAALNVLTLSVAAVAILTSLLTLASMRLPQLAPLWAMGLNRGFLAKIELTRALILAALTFVLAIPVGLGLAWVLLSVINVEAFGWRLPMHIFPEQWLWLGLLSLAAAGLAAAWPARQLAKRPPADLIRVFTHER